EVPLSGSVRHVAPQAARRDRARPSGRGTALARHPARGLTPAVLTVDGLLLDIDCVLVTSWQPVPGAIDAMAAFRGAGVPVCLITNTTTHPRTELAATLARAGFEVAPDMIVTASTSPAEHLRPPHPAASVCLLSDGDARADLDGVRLVDEPADAD